MFYHKVTWLSVVPEGASLFDVEEQGHVSLNILVEKVLLHTDDW